MKTVSLLGSGFTYECTIKRKNGEVVTFTEHNLLPQESIDFSAKLLLGTVASNANWYVGIFEGNYVPDLTVKAVNLQSLVVECTAYSGATRPLWAGVYDDAAVIDNLASQTALTMTATKLVYGAFIVSAPTKGGTNGILLSICRFTTPRQVVSGDTLLVGAGLTLADAS
jgi:hypothetical protein